MNVSFGSSGIRGPYGTHVTPELALAMGRAVAAVAGRRIVVGHDARTSAPVLAHALTAGLIAGGARVEYAGLLPTPALAYATRGRDAGVMLTASHNPAPDNGFKLWNPDGKAFDTDQRAQIERALREPPAGAAWDALAAEPVPRPDAVGAHEDAILSWIGPLERRLRVVLDCGNGAACAESPRLLRRLGCDVVTLNAQPDGRFPGRPSEPSEENLKDLASAVRATGADLGIAHDGDADRCMAVDERGRYVTGDELLCLLAREHAQKRIAIPVDASMTVEDVLEGVDVVRTRVGDAFVSEAIAERGADWGGEASGAWIFPALSLCPDGPAAAAAVIALVARRGPLGAQVDALPRYPLVRESVRVADRDAQSALLAHAATVLGALGPVDEQDGLRVASGDGWILVRPSGTEPKVRLTVEARSDAELERLLEVGRRAVRKSGG